MRSIVTVSCIAVALVIACTNQDSVVGVNRSAIGAPGDEAPRAAIEPSGLTTASDRPFNAVHEDNWQIPSDANLSIASQSDAPRSAPSVLQIQYPVGMPGGSSPTTMWRDVSAPAQVMYLSFWMKVSAQFMGNGSNRVAFLSMGGQRRVSMTLDGTTLGTLRPQMEVVNVLNYGGGRALTPNVASSATFSRNEWHRWEVVAQANTDGDTDGILEWWLDGTKVGSYRDIAFIGTSQANSWERVTIDPDWGNSGLPIVLPQTLLIDHATIDAGPIAPVVQPVASVSVALAASTVRIGQTTQATATPYDANGTALTGRSIGWTSSDTTIASVSSSGLVTAKRGGSARIIATSENVSGSAQLNVPFSTQDSTTVSTVTVTLDATTRPPGQTTQAHAVARDASGNVVTGRSVAWSSSNTGVATVNSSGVVTAVADGSAQITATVDSKTGSAAFTVQSPPAVATVTVTLDQATRQPGQTTQAHAVARDANGNVLTGRSVTWSSTDTDVGTVSSSGLVTANAPGSASIVATVEGKEGSATLTVQSAPPAPVATVTVTLAASTLGPGQTTQATATMRDSAGNVLTGRSVTWSSSNTNVATVTETGVVTANAVGTANIIATSEGKTGSATLTVQAQPAPVATVTVTLDASTLNPGQTTQARAVTRDSSGNVLTGRSVTWSSSNTSVATVSSAGVVTARAAGNANITATSEGKSGSAALTVQPTPVATVTVTLDASTIQPSQTTQAHAVARDANGNVLTGRSVAWSSSNTNVATVNTSGLVTGVGNGTSQIVATVEGKTGSATITVQAPAPVATVTVALDAPTLRPGQTTQAHATARDANGNVLTGRSISWSSNDVDVATVSPSGLVTANAEGSVSIIATVEGKQGNATLTVQANASSAAPEPGAGDVIIWQDNFDASTNFDDYSSTGSMSLITGRGNSGKAARFSYTPSSSDNLIEKSFAATTDIYFRYWYRTTPGWLPYSGRTGSGIKWFMPWRGGSAPRYTCGVGELVSNHWAFTCHDNSSSNEPNPFDQNVAPTPKFSTTNDGNWHEYVLHVVTGNSGYEQIWIDGVKVLDNQGMGYNHDAGGIALIQFPGLVVDGIPDNSWSGNIDIDDFVIWHR